MTVDREFGLSEQLYNQACSLMPGGVNSPVRAFRAVGGTPLYFQRGNGSKLIDVNGNEYIDFVSSWGAIIAGHANHVINKAIGEAAANGTSFGAPHEGEIRLAKQVIERVPSVERIRFVNSGTEAALAVVRLSRAATGRSKIIKFEGNYHGAIDSLLAKAGSGIATFGLPDSAGVPKEAAGGTLTARYNDIEDIQNIFDSNLGEIAAVIVEPVAGNMGLIPPEPGFLSTLRRLCTDNGALLILDEVMTGFRVGFGGATELYNAEPDLLMMGKVIGGGLPVGAYGGKKELMELVAPLGPMYQAGTLSGNPLAMAAGSAALEQLTPEAYAKLEQIGARLEVGLKTVLMAKGCRASVQRVGSMISVFFTESPVHNFGEANKSDKALYGRLFHALLRRGVYLPPSALESWFLNLAHTESDIDNTVNAFNDALTEVLT